MSKKINPLAEVFGFPVSNNTEKARRYREKKLCPFNNKVPNCTKDKANNPLGVCSIHHNGAAIITCPIRFREDWFIVENAAKFFFNEPTLLHLRCKACISRAIFAMLLMPIQKNYLPNFLGVRDTITPNLISFLHLERG